MYSAVDIGVTRHLVNVSLSFCGVGPCSVSAKVMGINRLLVLVWVWNGVNTGNGFKSGQSSQFDC